MQELIELNSVHCVGFEEKSMRVFVPTISVTDSKTEYRLMLDIPGLIPDSINLVAQEGTLLVTARVGRLRADFTAREFESGVRRFHYEWSIPEDTLVEAIEADFESGLLIISLPRFRDPDSAPYRKVVQ